VLRPRGERLADPDDMLDSGFARATIADADVEITSVNRTCISSTILDVLFFDDGLFSSNGCCAHTRTKHRSAESARAAPTFVAVAGRYSAVRSSFEMPTSTRVSGCVFAHETSLSFDENLCRVRMLSVSTLAGVAGLKGSKKLSRSVMVCGR